MVKNFIIILIIFATTTLHHTAFAHSGRTDVNGGHYDSTTGEYHYHHGYSAHQHPDGVCPYDNDDRTDDDTVESRLDKKYSNGDITSYYYNKTTNDPNNVIKSALTKQNEYNNFKWGEFLFQSVGILLVLFLGILYLRR